MQCLPRHLSSWALAGQGGWQPGRAAGGGRETQGSALASKAHKGPMVPARTGTLPYLWKALPRTPCLSYPCRLGPSLSPFSAGKQAQNLPLTLMMELKTRPRFPETPHHPCSPLPKAEKGPGLAEVWGLSSCSLVAWEPATQTHPLPTDTGPLLPGTGGPGCTQHAPAATTYTSTLCSGQLQWPH